MASTHKEIGNFRKIARKKMNLESKKIFTKNNIRKCVRVQAKSMLVLNYNRVITWVEQTGTSSYRSPYKSFICLQETVTKNQIRPTWDRSNSLITRKILLPPFFASCGFLCHSYQSHVESFRPVSCNHPYFTQNSCQDYYYDHSTIPDRRNYLRDPTTISWPVSFKVSEDRLLLTLRVPFTLSDLCAINGFGTEHVTFPVRHLMPYSSRWRGHMVISSWDTSNEKIPKKKDPYLGFEVSTTKR